MWHIVCQDILDIELSGPTLITPVNGLREALNNDKYLVHRQTVIAQLCIIPKVIAGQKGA